MMTIYYKIMLLYKRKKNFGCSSILDKTIVEVKELPHGGFKHTFLYFKEYDHEEFQNLTRMTVKQFNFLQTIQL